MGIFKNDVGRPSNETIKKRNIFKGICVVFGLIILILVGYILNDKGIINLNKKNKTISKEEKLPIPKVTGGERGKLGIDKNINESNIDKYLNRSDSVYRDMRMLEDPAKYENIGGDRFLSGYIKGFEVVPLPYLIPVANLPEAVGKTYSGKTLFSLDENGKYIPNYEESIKILEELFPKNKVLFLMCGGGGYAGMTKEFLVSLGWDETKIYNIGGYWYYNGKNNIKIDKTENGYDFSNVPYHEIKFNELKLKQSIYLDDIYYNNKVGKGIKELNFISLKDEQTMIASEEDFYKFNEKIETLAIEYGNKINQMLDNKESFVIELSSDDFCFSGVLGEANLSNNMLELSDENNLYYYKIGIKVFKKSRLYETVKYEPSIIIVYKGDILAYTDAESDEDLKYSTSKEEFYKWFTSYVNVKK